MQNIHISNIHVHFVQKFWPGWWAVRAKLVGPDNFLVLNLFNSGGPMVISKKPYFFKSPDRGGGGHKFQGVQPFPR